MSACPVFKQVKERQTAKDSFARILVNGCSRVARSSSLGYQLPCDSACCRTSKKHLKKTSTNAKTRPSRRAEHQSIRAVQRYQRHGRRWDVRRVRKIVEVSDQTYRHRHPKSRNKEAKKQRDKQETTDKDCPYKETRKATSQNKTNRPARPGPAQSGRPVRLSSPEANDDSSITNTAKPSGSPRPAPAG